MTAAVRKRVYTDQEVGELARDVDNRLGTLVPSKLVKFTGVYDEPMTFAYPYEPEGVLLIRAREDAEPETEQSHWVAANYVYENGTVRVQSVGLGLGVKYRFTWLVIG